MKKFEFKGVKFLVTVLVLLATLYFYDRSCAIKALEKSGEVFSMLLPIFSVVIVLMAVIGYFAKPMDILKHLGDESRSKSWFIAIGAGILSHGPMYAWYPLLEDMRKKGLRDGLVAAFFYARAVKLPLLPLMIDYFGVVFTVTLNLLILIASFFQGLLMEKLEKKRV